MPRTVILDQTTLRSDGSIELTWLKQIEDDGDIISKEDHRRIVDVDGDYAAIMDDVFDHLDAFKFRTSSAERKRMKDLVKAIDGVARADADMEARRQAAIAKKAAALEALTKRTR